MIIHYILHPLTVPVYQMMPIKAITKQPLTYHHKETICTENGLLIARHDEARTNVCHKDAEHAMHPTWYTIGDTTAALTWMSMYIGAPAYISFISCPHYRSPNVDVTECMHCPPPYQSFQHRKMGHTYLISVHPYFMCKGSIEFSQRNR